MQANSLDISISILNMNFKCFFKIDVIKIQFKPQFELFFFIFEMLRFR